MALEVEVAYLLSEKVGPLSDIRFSITKKNKGLVFRPWDLRMGTI